MTKLLLIALLSIFSISSFAQTNVRHWFCAAPHPDDSSRNWDEAYIQVTDFITSGVQRARMEVTHTNYDWNGRRLPNHPMVTGPVSIKTLVDNNGKETAQEYEMSQMPQPSSQNITYRLTVNLEANKTQLYRKADSLRGPNWDRIWSDKNYNCKAVKKISVIK